MKTKQWNLNVSIHKKTTQLFAGEFNTTTNLILMRWLKGNHEK